MVQTLRGLRIGARVRYELFVRFQLLAWSYASRIDAGILPRPLTLNPCSRAQDLNSKVLARFPLFCADSVAGGLMGCFLGVLDLVLALPLRAVEVLGKRLADADVFSSGEETTRVTLYMAPRTRTASSSDSVESMVTFKIVARLWISTRREFRRCVFDEKRYSSASRIARPQRSVDRFQRAGCNRKSRFAFAHTVVGEGKTECATVKCACSRNPCRVGSGHSGRRSWLHSLCRRASNRIRR